MKEQVKKSTIKTRYEEQKKLVEDKVNAKLNWQCILFGHAYLNGKCVRCGIRQY